MLKQQKLQMIVGFICFILFIMVTLSACAPQADNIQDQIQSAAPPLEDGAESVTRQPHPVSNAVLQEKYPEIVALRGAKGDKRVALTFDDGPDNLYTPQILDILQKHQVPATFYLVGSRVKAWPEIAKRIDQEGHIVGNHSYWHPDLSKDSVGRVDWEIAETEREITKAIGRIPSKDFRAPYGALNEGLVEHIGQMGYNAIAWDVDSLDWKQLTAEQVSMNVLSNVQPGSIILFHSAGNWDQDLSGTVGALEWIISELRKDGIKFVTVPQLLMAR